MKERTPECPAETMGGAFGNLKTVPVRSMSEEEQKEVMETMKANFDHQDEPEVGIFWYDKNANELFGVVKQEAMDVPSYNGRKTVRKLHKDYWNGEQHRAKGKGKNPAPFVGDYTQIPRGRIFQLDDGTFQVMCGSWMNDTIMALIIEEFNLKGQKVTAVIDEQ
jgi:hypothetical protein